MKRLNVTWFSGPVRWGLLLIALMYVHVGLTNMRIDEIVHRRLAADEKVKPRVPVYKDERYVRTTALKKTETRLALDGYCPVTLHEQTKWAEGDRALSSVNHSLKFYFADQAAKDKFDANPNRFTPALLGMDPVLYRLGNRRVMGTRSHGVKHRDRLYMFASDTSLRRFFVSPSDLVTVPTVPPNHAWDKIEDTPQHHEIVQIAGQVPNPGVTSSYVHTPQYVVGNPYTNVPRPTQTTRAAPPIAYGSAAKAVPVTSYPQTNYSTTSRFETVYVPQSVMTSRIENGRPVYETRTIHQAVTRPVHQISKEESELAKAIEASVRDYHKAEDDAEKTKVRDELLQQTTKHFELLQQRREKEIEKIEKRLEEVKSLRQQREDNRQTIIDAQVKRLLGQPDPLAWDEPTGRVVPSTNVAPQPGGTVYRPVTTTQYVPVRTSIASPNTPAYPTPQIGTPIGLPGPPATVTQGTPQQLPPPTPVPRPPTPRR